MNPEEGKISSRNNCTPKTDRAPTWAVEPILKAGEGSKVEISREKVWRRTQCCSLGPEMYTEVHLWWSGFVRVGGVEWNGRKGPSNA